MQEILRTLDKSPLNRWIEQNYLTRVVSVLFGISLLAALAQVRLPLPYTPIPITGQTFGVSVLSLWMGRKWGFTTVALYVVLGAVGLPIFAGFASGLRLATSGYLIGMCLAALVMGSLADAGWTRTWPKAFLTCLLGSVCVFACGITILHNFIPTNSLVWAGIVPFIPGDVIKSALAATLGKRNI